MQSLKNSYIKGVLSEYAGKRDQIISDLLVYLENPVGVGDHGDISAIIKSKISDLDSVDSQIATIQKYFFSEQPSADSGQNSKE